jgi:hypothetical protein
VSVAVSSILAGCSAGGQTGQDEATSAPDEQPGSATTDDDGLSVELTGGSSAVQLGQPFDVIVTVANGGPRSVSATVELTLVSPAGTRVAFHRATLFVPFGDAAAESTTVTTARWTGEVGEFGVDATITEPASVAPPDALTFDVGPTSRVVPVFEDVTERVGLVTEVPEPTCGQFANGAAWGDVDGDALPDLVLTRLGEPAQVFVSDADGTFTEESSARGVDVSGANGASFADYDRDGDADLVLVGDGPDVLLRNDGTGHFDDVSGVAGIAGDPAHRGTSAAWGDYDRDGLVDLYVTNYMACTGPWTTESEIITNVEYHADLLFHNEGDGTFTDATASLPDPDVQGAAFSSAWFDADEDGLLDLYVGNDFVGLSPDHNRLWRNTGVDGAGQGFIDVSLESGAGLYMNTMGIGIGDVDRDGDLDLALSNIGGNKLLRGTGDAEFVEAIATGIERPMQSVDHTTVTWGTVVADFDLDGWEDVFMAAGNLTQGPDVAVGDQPDMLFVNDGTGEHFLDVSALTGTDDVGDSKGVAAADYDADGALDLFVVDQSGLPHLYRNVTPRVGRHWLEVDLTGTRSDTDACGAVVRVIVAGDTIRRTVLCGSGGTGSAHHRRVHVGLGTSPTIDSVEITWPSGVQQVLEDVAVDRIVGVVEPA